MTKTLLALWASAPATFYYMLSQGDAPIETGFDQAIALYGVFLAPYIFFGTTMLLLAKFGLMPMINYLFKGVK